MKTFTKDFIRENSGCYSCEKLAECSFMRQEGNTVTLESIVKSEIPLMDKFWFVNNMVATPEENQQLAIQCAEAVLPIYEKCYPGNTALRQVIETIKLYIAGYTDILELISKKKAVAVARAAYAAADAATYAARATYCAAYAAADAAADAARATYCAADAAAYVARAAYAAADAAAYAADAAVADTDAINLNEQLLQILIDYSITKV